MTEKRAERRRSMKISELREQAIEAMDQTPYIDVETESGDIFRVWHPLLQADDAQIRIDRVNAGEDLLKDDDGNPVVPNRKPDGELAEPFTIRTARAIMGDKDHAKFIKLGGRSNDIQLAWNEMVRQYEGLLEDESDPKS